MKRNPKGYDTIDLVETEALAMKVRNEMDNEVDNLVPVEWLLEVQMQNVYLYETPVSLRTYLQHYWRVVVQTVREIIERPLIDRI